MAPQRVAILGFHDGSAGQVESWFEQVTGTIIDCFIVEGAEAPVVDASHENAKRSNKRTSFPSDGLFKGRPLIAAEDWVDALRARAVSHVLPLTSSNMVRLRQAKQVLDAGLNLVSAIHPSVRILADAVVDPGVWINADCVIGYKAEIGVATILNTRVLVEHHNVLREGCQLDPGVVTAGNVTIDSCAHIHTGAVIINRVTVGREAIVGAGAVVIHDVAPGTTVVGVPAREIKKSSVLT